jgi:dihydropteroate synthase
MARTYIRPLGVPSGSHVLAARAAAGESSPALLPLAGREHLAFFAAELIERAGGIISRRLVSAANLARTQEPGVRQTLDLLRQPRPAIAGISLDRPRIMGIVNVTPDSFSDGGHYLAPEAAVAHAMRLEEEGADFLDIGGESTRPGAEPITIDDECRRVLPVIEALAKRARVPISVDTRNAEVMRRAVDAGARMINDVSALMHDPDSLAIAAASGLPVVLMHAKGDPRIMQRNPTYDDVVLDVYDALAERLAACEAVGIPRGRLIVDPGIGFGKTLAHNLALLGALSIFHGLGCPILLGASRKSFITKLTGAAADDRLPASLAAALQGLAQGVQIVRVHDVAATRQAIALWQGVHGRLAG